MSGVLVTQGTQTTIKTTADGGSEIQHIRGDGGTLGLLSNLTNGTVRMAAGTQQTLGTVGVINGGTISTLVLPDNNFATVVSSGTTDFGTIKAAVAGSAIYITDLIVSVGSATVVEIGDGTVGASNLVGSLNFSANGGMVSNFNTPLKTSTGGTLVYKQSATGPLTITALGFVK